ncbi:Glycine betaine transport ATP-binding protein OpuAA [Chryseobacterium sp. MOF25P]|uniref:quaternary amine ABC transporter ATP-binding protein n=1 Tax=unclassified Chryseobacterium TaxID=2593645 RepID=UPI00080504D5|nr:MULTISPECIES: glycine betaine/L-proline ABC transporter ATP-binding protein [unclassified Chryseobacterium]OBW42318.1 Glycine betaine transport ATP-binding protein OpuAA [Chryseobacterium sp. MOF25P]OBW47121.1 Glycine betaine transport ATP-binding protein OpuAA [Chryseobacterium sp. BGARF1]
MDTIDTNRKVKLKVEDLTIIFGKNKEKALELLDKGFSKKEILEKTGCTVGINKASFEIYEGEFFVIMGLSGSGKSTLLRCLNRLNEPTAGKVYINNDNITDKNNKDLLEVRRTEMSMVFQKFGLLPHHTVLSNAAFGLEIRGESKTIREEKAQKALDIVGLNGFENQLPSQLSGGMQQRVGLARALANDPEVLLMDEAFSALDPLIKSEMQDQLLELQETLQKTIVFITHDLDEAIKIGDRIVIMKDGVIEQIGTAEDILTNPASDYVKAFVEKVDRKTIITAKSLMFDKPTVVRFRKDGPEGALRKMRTTGLETLPVVDFQNRFLGFVTLSDIVQIAKKKEPTVESVINSNVPSVYQEATVEEMLPLISGSKSAIAVVDETNKFLGLVTQLSLIIEATKYNEEEIIELKEIANNQ